MSAEAPKLEWSWSQVTLFAGLDWARQKHDLVAVDGRGAIRVELTIAETAEGWAALRQALAAEVGADLSLVAVAVETNNGPAVERLLDLGCRVYPLNPKAAGRYRERKAPSGSRNDRLDAWSFADALRTDGQAWRPLVPDDPLTQELRLLCRDEVHLIRQRTALVNQLQQALLEYYPAALEAFDEWVCAGAWAFVEQFPTPADLAQAGRRRWEKFLHTQRLWRPETATRRLEIFARATTFCGPPAVTRAKSRLALTLARQLRLLESELKGYRAAIEELFRQHPDRDVFGSLPGAGEKLAPRLLSELGDNRQRFSAAEGLQSYAGTAPVSIESGLQQAAAHGRVPVGQPEPGEMPLGGALLRRQTRGGQKPRHSPALPGPALAEDSVADVARPSFLRRSAALEKYGSARHLDLRVTEREKLACG
jgi:transposase